MAHNSIGCIQYFLSLIFFRRLNKGANVTASLTLYCLNSFFRRFSGHSVKGPIHAQAVFRPSERRWPGGRLNRPHTREFCLMAALSLAETLWSAGMASKLERNELHLLSATAVAATLMTKKEKSRN